MKKLNTGLASFGLSGRAFHYPFLAVNENIDLKKIVIRNAAQKQLPDFPDSVEIVPAFDTLIDDPEIELVVVNTPDYLHFEMAKKALLAGKHVVVEKPFTGSREEAEELFSIAEEKNLIITPYQNRRFDGDFMTVKSLIETGMLKNIVDYRSSFSKFSVNFDSSKWSEQEGSGWGAIYNIGSHLADQAVSLFGLPESVFCISKYNRPGTKIDDFMVLTLFYPNMTAELRCSFAEKIFSHRFHVNALNGSFLKFGIDPQEAVLRSRGKDFVLAEGENWGEDSKENWGSIDADGSGLKKVRTINGNYSLFYDNVAKAVRREEEIEVKKEQVLAVLKIIELGRESAESGKVLKFN